MKGKKLVIFIMGFLLCSKLFAQSGSFVSIPLNARSVSMGNTYIAQENSNAVFTNLAASSVSNKSFEVNLNYRPWLNELSNDYSLASISSYFSIGNKNSIAVGFKNYSMPNYIVNDTDGNDAGTYTPNEFALALGYAYRISNKSAVSLSIQYLGADLGDNAKANTIFVDLGYKSSYRQLEYGVTIKNLGPELKFDNSSSSLPLTIGAGVAYSEKVLQKHTIMASMDFAHMSLNDEAGFSSGIGLQYTYNDLFFLRSGYHFVDDTIGLSAFSFGTGLQIKSFAVDFSYLLSDNVLNNNFNFTCSFKLNKMPRKYVHLSSEK